MVFWFRYICQYFLIPTVSALSNLNFTRTIILPSSWVLKRENDIWFYIKSANEQSTVPKLTSSFATRFREVNFVRLTDGAKTSYEVNGFNEVNISVLFHKNLSVNKSFKTLDLPSKIIVQPTEKFPNHRNRRNKGCDGIYALISHIHVFLSSMDRVNSENTLKYWDSDEYNLSAGHSFPRIA